MATLTHNIKIFTDGSIQVESADPVTGSPLSDYYRVRCGFEYASDHKARGWSVDYDLAENGYPDMCKTEVDAFMEFNKTWQLFFFDLMKQSAGDIMNEAELKKAWARIHDSKRYLLNGNGVDVYKDIIRKVNLIKRWPRFQALTCGRDNPPHNIVKGLGEEMKNGKLCVRVLALDPKTPPMPGQYTRNKDPHLIHEARTELMVDGINVNNPFHWLKERPVCFAFTAPGGVQWIEKRRLERLTVDRLPEVLR